MAIAAEDQLPVTAAVVAWARARAGFSVDEAAEYFPKIAQWESGALRPTYPQLEQMSDKFRVPVAVFFFPSPPEIEPVTTSFRTLSLNDLELIPRPIHALLRKGQAMQLNLVELNDGRSPARSVITRDVRFTLDAPLRRMCDIARTYLGVSLEEQQRWPSVDEGFERWRDALANVGVFVFKDAFHLEDYFGFCLYDDEFPIIYVNNSCAKTRQIFTLLHELGHLLFHTSGIDVRERSFQYESNNAREIEVRCNAFAAEFLLPETAFESAIRGRRPDRDTAADVANRFKVSREVVYRRMLDRGLISQAEYADAAATWARQARPGGTGGNFYYTQFAYLGRRYIDLALSRYYQQRFDDVRLAEYLNIKPRSIATFEELYSRS